MNNHFKTIIISDVRLGSNDSKARQLARFLTYNTCDKLVLNGDIIDESCFRGRGFSNLRLLKFFASRLRMIKENGTEICYVKGKADPWSKDGLPLILSKLSIVDRLVIDSGHSKFLVIHGDIVDLLNSWTGGITRFGDLGIRFIFWLNDFLNRYGLKNKLWLLLRPSVLVYKPDEKGIERIEERLARFTSICGFDGIICGYTNKPVISTIGSVRYMNSGDWIHSLSAITEEYTGEWSLVFYNETGNVRRSKAV